MRKLLSIALLFAVALPLLAPLLAVAQNSDAALPACCRRDGQHHCAMRMGERVDRGTEGRRLQAPLERCPFCPATVPAFHADRWSTPQTAEAIFAAIVSHPGGTPQTDSLRRIARDRSRQKRGPPAHLSL